MTPKGSQEIPKGSQGVAEYKFDHIIKLMLTVNATLGSNHFSKAFHSSHRTSVQGSWKSSTFLFLHIFKNFFHKDILPYTLYKTQP